MKEDCAIKKSDGFNTKNIMAISTMGLAQAMAGGFVGVYIAVFYTDVMGISAASMALLLLLARLWDAINDPLVAIYMDNSPSTKLGKYKPFMILGNILVTIFTILMFTVPNFSGGGKLVYAYITYFSWSLAYTLFPVSPIISAITRSPLERSTAATAQRIVVLVVGFSAAAFMPLTEKLGGGAVGFYQAIMIFMIPLMIISLGGTALVKEPPIVAPKGDKVVLKDLILLFIENRAMAIFALYIFINGMVMPFMNAALVYYIKYSYGVDKMFYIMPLAMGGFLAGVTLTGIILRFISRKKLLIIAYLLQAVVFFLLFALQSIPFSLAFILIGVADLAMGLTVTPQTTMTMEIMDYNQVHRGKRMAAVIAAMELFLSKLQGALAGAAVGLTLSIVGFVANEEMSLSVFRGLTVIGFLIPAIFALLSVVVLFFYPINEEDAVELVSQL